MHVFSRSNRLDYFCGKPTDFLMTLTINGIQVALKKGSSIEYVSENRLFIDADDYSMEIELPLADCPRNLGIFGHLTRKDVDMGDIFFDAVLQDTNFFKRGAVVITGICNESVKVQFLERRSYQNFFPRFDETYIDELDLGVWPNYYLVLICSDFFERSEDPCYTSIDARKRAKIKTNHQQNKTNKFLI